jgi:hypothetical protein
MGSSISHPWIVPGSGQAHSHRRLCAAVLGASFPGLIAYRVLENAGYDVHLFGKKEERGVLSGFGPRHLWDTPALRLRLPDAPRTTMRVLWPALGANLEYERVDPSLRPLCYVSSHFPLDTAEYWSRYRAASRNLSETEARRDTLTAVGPCRGRLSFSVVHEGFARLDALIRAASIHPRSHRATKVQAGVRRRWAVASQVIGATPAGSCMTTDEYDLVVTTLPPSVFGTLANIDKLRRGYTLGPVAFGLSLRVPVLGAEHRDVIYNAPPFAEVGSPTWHRASFNGSDWCYEHRGSIPTADLEGLYGHGQFAMLNTQLSSAPKPEYPEHVYPVGRFAEWDSELMVSDVFENLHWSGSETGWNL